MWPRHRADGSHPQDYALRDVSMKPVIYQLLPRLYGNTCDHCVAGGTAAVNGCGRMGDFDLRTLAAIRDLGATHVWYTGILDHATQTDHSDVGKAADDAAFVKGLAGSPYAVRDYYDVCPDLAVKAADRLKEFTLLVRRTHRAGMGAIIDFVPNHVATCYRGTREPFTEANYYPGHYHDGDWTDTVKLNYGNPDTRQKMLDILLYWSSMGVDGFRCDMAELVPVDFWAWAIPRVKAVHPDTLFIAEVYDPWRYEAYALQGGFDYLYDKVGLYDTLVRILRGQEPAADITHCWQRLGALAPRMLHFMENHDEQRLASDFLFGHGRRALPAMVVSTCMDTCPVMVYAGQELGERGMDAEGFSGTDGKTTIFDYWSVGSLRRWRRELTTGRPHLTDDERALRDVYRRLLRLAADEPAIARGAFFDLMYVNPASAFFNPDRHYAFLRREGDTLIVVCTNFGAGEADVRIVIPQHAFDYLELPVAGQRLGMDLLTDREQTVTLSPDVPVCLHLDAYGSVILKITL